MEKLSIPFKIKNVFEGFAETEGVLAFDGECMRLQFRTKDALLGVIKSDIKDLEVNLKEIEEVNFNKSIFGNTLTIRMSNLNTSSKLPRQSSGEIKLSIEKKHTDLALNFVAQTNI